MALPSTKQQVYRKMLFYTIQYIEDRKGSDYDNETDIFVIATRAINNDTGVLYNEWSVPGVPEPTLADLRAIEPATTDTKETTLRRDSLRRGVDNDIFPGNTLVREMFRLTNEVRTLRGDAPWSRDDYKSHLRSLIQ